MSSNQSRVLAQGTCGSSTRTLQADFMRRCNPARPGSCAWREVTAPWVRRKRLFIPPAPSSTPSG